MTTDDVRQAAHAARIAAAVALGLRIEGRRFSPTEHSYVWGTVSDTGYLNMCTVAHTQNFRIHPDDDTDPRIDAALVEARGVCEWVCEWVLEPSLSRPHRVPYGGLIYLKAHKTSCGAEFDQQRHIKPFCPNCGKAIKIKTKETKETEE